jgi:hypothetical protein
MAKIRLTVFLCTGKDCTRAWDRLCSCSPRKWLKTQIKQAGLPYKLNVVETSCQDDCDRAACLCCVADDWASQLCKIRSADDADRILAALRSCAEVAEIHSEHDSLSRGAMNPR